MASYKEKTFTSSSVRLDRHRVDLSTPDLARHWCKHFGRSKESVEAAIAEVGDNAETVMKELGVSPNSLGVKRTSACALHMSAFDPKRTSAAPSSAMHRSKPWGKHEATGIHRRSVWCRDDVVRRRAQQPAMPVVGFLRPGSPELNAHLLAAFRKGMGETGYVEGRNVAVEYRWAGNDDRLRELAADLVRPRVNVIVTPGGTTAAAAAKSETTTIPIVFSGGGDPVESGWSPASTGRAAMSPASAPWPGNWGQTGWVVAGVGPAAARLAVLINPNNPTSRTFVAESARKRPRRGRQLEILTASTAATSMRPLRRWWISGLAHSWSVPTRSS